MSSTTGKNRLALDGYYTPLACARALVRTLDHTLIYTDDFAETMLAVEPSVGGGAFAIALRELAKAQGNRELSLCGVDLNPDATGLKMVDHPIAGDWLTVNLPFTPRLIVGNPPFSHAEAHVRRALDVMPSGGVAAFLLRLAFLESSTRAPFWDRYFPCLRTVYALVERPSFTGGETDSCPYGFFVFQVGRHARPAMERLSWKSAPALTEVR